MGTLLVDAAFNPQRQAELQRELKALNNRVDVVQGALDELTAVWLLQEPAEDGSVIRFRKYDHKYWFAAIRIDHLWFITQDGSRTSRQGYPPREWENLLEWIGERNYGTVEVLS